MKNTDKLARKSYFLGSKIRKLRKDNNLTMDDLSSRCVRIDADTAPSVSYLSMIERGKRTPSYEILDLISQVFQKPLDWFLDDSSESKVISPEKGRRGGITGVPLEPSFLFSNEILQIAIPEMLSQTGTSGTQFAHLLIRAHQENNQNNFPELERAAEEIGHKRMPLSLDDLISITKEMGLKICWFKAIPKELLTELHGHSSNIVSSFFSPPNSIHINELLKQHPKRFKYDLSVHIGHCVLHGNDSVKSVLIAGRNRGGNYPINQNHSDIDSFSVNAQHILHAWRDFECSFFAGALLCPRIPFKQLLDRHHNEFSVSRLLDISVSVVTRRMTAVSPYPYWHYFDAYSGGKLKAVYRGNGIPLPWGNMRMVEDPCQHWSVFRMLNTPENGTAAQISILNVSDEPRIYCCESLKVHDLTGESHVLCAGIDLNPAIEARGEDAVGLASELKEHCVSQGGTAAIPKNIKAILLKVAKVLNIAWVERGISDDARVICTRGSTCPRIPSCYDTHADSPLINIADPEIVRGF